jgi:hypothetical protein
VIPEPDVTSGSFFKGFILQECALENSLIKGRACPELDSGMRGDNDSTLPYLTQHFYIRGF